MNVEFLEKFSKDVNRIQDKSVRKKIEKIISNFKEAKSLHQLTNVKKLEGFKNAFRIKLGDYRIGFFFENDTAEFARIAHRKEIYRLFP
jgi:mRNA interferase RelE/StbE